MNECFYCLDCQVAYYDDHICPPLVWRRKRQQPHQARGRARKSARSMKRESVEDTLNDATSRKHLTAEPRCRAGER